LQKHLTFPLDINNKITFDILQSKDYESEFFNLENLRI
jgi:hypothetical protein